MGTPRLVVLPYSPWSQKARWALRHHRIAHRALAHLPMVGEPLLRARAGWPKGPVSVPLLLTDEGPIGDSFAIARWADARGEGEPLATDDPEVAAWNARAETVLSAGRALALERTLGSRKALAGSVPGPSFLAPLLAPIGRLGVHFVARKYAAVPSETLRAAMRDELLALRAALDGRAHVLARGFTFADMAMACALTFVRPAGPGRDHLHPDVRPVWGDEALAADFGDLLAWRDRTLAERMP